LLIPILVASDFIQHRKQRQRTLLIALAVLVVGAVFFGVVSHGLIPNSIRVKVAQGQFGWLGVSYFEAFHSYSWSTSLAWTLLVLGLIVLCLRPIGVAKTPLLLLLVFGAVQYLTYSIAKAPAGYPWYRFPAVIGFNLVAACGIRELLEFVGMLRTPMLQRNLLYNILLGICVGLSVSIFGFDSPAYFSSHYRYSGEYEEFGRWLKEIAGEDDTIAAAEIGYIGYYSQRPILDIHGLIHPRWRQQIAQHKYWWFAHRPNFVVTHTPSWPGEPSPNWPEALRQDFENNYHEIKVLGGIRLFALNKVNLLWQSQAFTNEHES